MISEVDAQDDLGEQLFEAIEAIKQYKRLNRWPSFHILELL